VFSAATTGGASSVPSISFPPEEPPTVPYKYENDMLKMNRTSKFYKIIDHR
jgi:hypothetical protein